MVEPHDERCSSFIFIGQPLVSEGATNSNHLFDLFNICVATVDVVSNSCDGSEEGLVSGNIVGEWDGVSGSAEW